MPKYRCPECRQEKDTVLHVFEVMMKYDPMGDEYLPREDEGRIIIRCAECRTEIETW
jgi:hypothetical protein